MNDEIALAADALSHGRLVIYPTETLYALGAGIMHPAAMERIAALKQRDQNKPLPVIIGSLNQLEMITDWQDAGLARLIKSFWPGPLSILVPARPGLSPAIQDENGFIAVRWTPHPVAQDLAVRTGSPLVATSANPGGGEPASRPEGLDPLILQGVDVVIRQPPYPAGGQPSTVLRILSSGHLVVLRTGAVSLDQLRAKGWRVGLKI